MSLGLALQALEAIAVTVGVVFGLIQLRQLRHQREVQAGTELLHSLYAAEMAEPVRQLCGLPDNLGSEELRNRMGENFDRLIAVLTVFESIGPLVARGLVPIEMYAEFYRGVTIICWRKLRRYIEEGREEGWPNLYERVQWLAERMEERIPLGGDVPAFEQFKSWRSAADYERLAGQSSQPQA